MIWLAAPSPNVAQYSAPSYMRHLQNYTDIISHKMTTFKVTKNPYSASRFS